MNRTNIPRANIKGVSATADSSNTPLAAITRKLEELSSPPKTTSRFRIRREARIQAVRWLNRLDTTEKQEALAPPSRAGSLGALRTCDGIWPLSAPGAPSMSLVDGVRLRAPRRPSSCYGSSPTRLRPVASV
jgi:hypothetical protein